MKLNVYSIFDEKAQAYLRPLYANQHAEAIRSFHGAVLEDKGFSKFPEDFRLYFLAVWDTDSGKFKSEPQPVFMANATDFVKRENEGGTNG